MYSFDNGSNKQCTDHRWYKFVERGFYGFSNIAENVAKQRTSGGSI